ncbi:hypothetical protein, partial [Desulfogranum marinum]|uniref:hypothetical protein n=1 Tax=Desulfogranum marinum TaxID=453220 RepID=UPI0019633A49
GSLVLAGVAAVAVGSALYLSLQPADLLKYQQEWVKALLQAGLITVLGVVTSSVLESFKEGLQQKRNQSRIRFDILNDIGRIYMDVKLARRRAQAVKRIESKDLQELNERQVQLELHKFNSVKLFKNHQGLEDALGTMEKYLNKVANKPETDEHQRFVDREGFRKFSVAFHEAKAIMQHYIVGT